MTVKKQLEDFKDKRLTIHIMIDMINYDKRLLNIRNLDPDVRAKVKAYINAEENEVITLKSQCNALKDMLSELSDYVYQDVLTMRYIDGYTIQETAERLCYSDRQIARLTNQAIKELEEKQTI